MRRRKMNQAATAGESLPDVVGSRNVFAHLGLSNPDERLVKSRLMHAFNEAVKRLGLTLAQAAKRVGLEVADIRRISFGQGSRYTAELLRTLSDRLDDR